MIGDQLTSLEAPFYNSKNSKPNGSASPFGDAQLDDTKLHSAAMALCSRWNVQRVSVGQSDSNALGDFSKQGTPAPSDAGNLVLTAASVRYTEEDLQTMTSSAWFVLSDSSQSSQTNRPMRSVKITSIHTAGATCSNNTPFASIFFVVESAFIGTSSSVGRTRQSITSCLGLSLRFFFERVWVTQGLLCIPPGVALDKTSSIRGRKFRMGRLTSFPIYPYQVWYWQGPRRAQTHLILSRKTQALAQGE